MLTSLLLDQDRAHKTVNVALSCDTWFADEVVASGRLCHRPCPVSGCNGRFDHAYNHGGSHECDANASHPNW
jgi:hypothetical protein